MAKTTGTKLVRQFVESATPRSLLELNAALAELDYPIEDKVSFDAAVEQAVGNEDAAKLFSQVLTPVDFPLASANSALEKFNFRLPAAAQIVALKGGLPGLPQFEDPIRDFIPPLPPKAALKRLLCRANCDAELRSCLARTTSMNAAARCILAHWACRQNCGS